MPGFAIDNRIEKAMKMIEASKAKNKENRRYWRQPHICYSFFLLGFLLFTACEQTTLPHSQPSSSGTTISSPTTTLTPTSTAPSLASLPQNCPVGSIPPKKFSAIGPVVGQSPVWVTGFDGSSAEIHITPSSDTYTQYGWIWKLVWEVGPRFTQKVTIHGTNMKTGVPLLFQFLNGSVNASPVLNPQQPDHPQSAISNEYKEWGSSLYISTAGCYSLDAAWTGGHWRVLFAAGR